MTVAHYDKEYSVLDWLFSPEAQMSELPFQAFNNGLGLTVFHENNHTTVIITNNTKNIMTKYSKTSVANDARVELHDILGLTGAEVSINSMPAGAEVPFVHAHKQNEEIYGILSGKGTMTLDGEKVALQAGDWLRVAPEVKRMLAAAPDEGITYICIQAKAGSLEGFTMTDAIV